MHILARLKLKVQADSWFDKLSQEQKEQYVQEHPRSKYSKEYKAKQGNSKQIQNKKQISQTPAEKEKKAFFEEFKNSNPKMKAFKTYEEWDEKVKTSEELEDEWNEGLKIGDPSMTGYLEEFPNKEEAYREWFSDTIDNGYAILDDEKYMA